MVWGSSPALALLQTYVTIDVTTVPNARPMRHATCAALRGQTEHCYQAHAG